MARIAHRPGVRRAWPAGALGAAPGQASRRARDCRRDRAGHGPVVAGLDLPAVGVRRHQRGDRNLSLSPGLALTGAGSGEGFVRHAADSIVVDGRADVLLPRRRLARIRGSRGAERRRRATARDPSGECSRAAKANAGAARAQGSGIQAAGNGGGHEAAEQGQNRNQAAQQGVEEAGRAFPGACSRRKARSRTAKKRWPASQQNAASVQKQRNQTRQAGSQPRVEETAAGGKTRTALLSFASRFPASSVHARSGKEQRIDRKEAMPRHAAEPGRKSGSVRGQKDPEESGQRPGLDPAPSRRFALQKGLVPLGRQTGPSSHRRIERTGGDQTARCPGLPAGIAPPRGRPSGRPPASFRSKPGGPGSGDPDPGDPDPGDPDQGSGPGSRPGTEPRRAGPGFGPRRQDGRSGGQAGASRTSYPASRPPRPSTPSDGDSQTTRPRSAPSSRPAKPWQRTGLVLIPAEWQSGWKTSG